MTCKYRNNDSDTLLACMGLAPLYDAASVQNYASRAGADGYVYNFVVACLRVNRQIRPNIPEGPCDSGTFVVAPTTESTDIGLANRSAQQVGTALAPATLGLSELAANIFTSLTSFFGGIFSGAPSQQELQVDCAVTNDWNSFANQYEAALSSGGIALQDALVQLKSIYTQVDGALSHLQGYNKTDWAPYFHRKANDALYIFNKEVIYPQLASGSSTSSGTVPLVIGGGILAAKFLGAF